MSVLACAKIMRDENNIEAFGEEPEFFDIVLQRVHDMANASKGVPSRIHLTALSNSYMPLLNPR